jgi:septal ring factor EnvC (AmiA/AmiB activator)
MEIHKGVIDDFRRHILSSPGISDAERRMHAAHSAPADECVASAALFELRGRKNELAPQAAELEAAMNDSREKKDKLQQELFKSRNKFDSLVDMVSDAASLASKSKAAISAAMADVSALMELWPSSK